MGAWTRTPPRFSGALARFFPENIGLTSVKKDSARWNPHHIATSMMATIFEAAVIPLCSGSHIC
jgi:hypothetical protein